MNKREKSLIALGIGCLCLGIATPSFAQSYSDITGTNVWNSVPVMLDNADALDPELVARVTELNETSAIAYEDCKKAIEAIEAQYQNEPQRFTREDISPEPPLACVALEEARQEMATLRVQLAQLQAEIDETSSFTW
ncbi:hypothetical protein Lepto7376_4075 [[Leptolyngbya] sp. PCC 7376]|uniref:hypothetical protein n=1 Tax=[Leptolyngbya] sp. PCC 7376 TaxID=111781 RepID=UPI00029ED4EB|nr:hypothetical protein [[Leptolyngbya] sp. PCC 7376]AFY40205.1 hypothetical protein Lepto7376_4075 [[Leptolyngbya] sp. PCC 7376]